MQSASVTLIDKLKQDLAIYAQPRLIAEWSLNRYVTVQSCTNPALSPSAEFNLDLFPITSIVEADRPGKGILKAIASTASQVAVLGGDGFATKGYTDAPSASARYMTSSQDDKYKYYTSGTTAGSTYSTSPTAISGVQPTVIYASAAWCNKLYIGVETSYAQPSAYTIDITTDGTNWTNVASQATAPVNADGSIVIYRQANGTWSTTVYRDNPVQIRGVRMTVTQMNRGGVRFNLIELGGRLESDLSQFVVSYSVENSMSETSFVAPLGVASANTARVNLSNIDARFTDDNPASLYYKLLEKNVEFRMDLGINIGTVASPNWEYVRQFTMRTETWNDQSREGTDVELNDDANFLQSVKPQPALYQNMTIGEIIWRMLDSVGYSKWAYNPMSSDPTMLIPQFWNDGNTTVWASISKLAQETQTAIYFNEFGILQIKTRNAAFNLTNSSVWQLDAVANGSKQPDIQELRKTYDFEANLVNIRYKPTSISKESASGVPTMETIWEPEDTVVLRSSNLTQTLSATGVSMVITPIEAKTWPYDGIVQCEGEFIRYIAKGYTYKNAAGTWVSVYIKSQDEKEALDRLHPTGTYVNYFNGFLWIQSLANRGLWGTTAKTHELGTSNWTRKRYRHLSGAVTNWSAGFIHNKSESTVSLITNSTFGGNSWYVVGAGNTADAPPMFFGTRVKFTSGRAAGLVMGSNTNDAGYYVELNRTASISATDRQLWTNELCFYVRKSDGSIHRYGANWGKGVPMNIVDGVWYDIDVRAKIVGSDISFTISVNGAHRMTVVVTPSTGTGLYFGGGIAMFTRGYTNAKFEYFYTSTAQPITFLDPFDEEGWWDRVKGGYQSGQWDRQWTYGYTYNSTLRYGSTPPSVVSSRYGYRFMDEFGPIVHEVREFDVEFTKSPVLHSSLYISNDSQVINPEYRSNPFRASFVLANTSRENAVVSGEDTLTYGSDNPVTQQMLIYGRTFTQDEERTETVRDDAAVKRRGEQALDIESEWIQSEAAAKSLGQWIVYHWSGGCDEVSVTSFGNPLLQLGDVVSVNYPLMNMSPSTHEYFIVGIEHSYNKGLETTLKLRRRIMRYDIGGGLGVSAPIVITTGGTYSGWYASTDSTTPAVQISTTQPVTLNNCRIDHAGVGVKALQTGSQVTVTNCTFTALTPSVTNAEQQAVNAWEPAKLTVEHNRMTSGHGVQVSTATANSVQTNPLSISYNDFIDVGKLSQPVFYQGAIHLDKVTAPNGKILWNRVTNHYGSSWGEDEIALARTQGTVGNPIEIAHCLVNGVYPISGNGASFTGGAIDLADIGGGYLNCHHCYVIGYTNNGIMQPTNVPGVTIDNCVAVYDGIADNETTTVSSTFGWGITVDNQYTTGTQSVVTNCRVGHRRWNGSAWESANYQWENQGTQDGGGNTTLTASAANEQAMIAEFEASVVSAAVVIGPQ